MSTNRKKALAAINAAKKETVDKQFSMDELRALARQNGYTGSNNFWQCFKMLLTREKRGVYTWKETKYPFNLAQLEHVLEKANKYNKPPHKEPVVEVVELSEEEKAIALLKSKGYRIFRVVTVEEEV